MIIGLANILQILGALAFFIYGMKVMSEGVQKAGGVPLRKVLSLMTRNRALGVLTGFLLTIFVQSSSATTVMIVSFVNAGLLSLVESAGLIMGANIGTTITAWIISILGFQVKLHILSIPIFALAVPLLFIKKGKAKFWGEFLIGFAILFLGLQFLKESVPNIENDSELLAYLARFANRGVLSGLLFVLIGALSAVIVQSSSAAMALTLVMSANGWIPFEVAATMVLGQNIGTTITAEVAALVGNVFAKRSARIHTLFNILGVGWMFLVLPIFLENLDYILQQYIYTNSAYTDSQNVPIALAAFHTIFNIINTLLFIGLIPWLVTLASKTVKSKGGEDEISRLYYVKSLVSTSELSILETQKKVKHFGEIVGKMSHFVRTMLFTINEIESEEMTDKIIQYENLSHQISTELSDYLMKISKEEVSTKTAIKIKGLLDCCGELNRTANIFYQTSKTIKRKRAEKIWFNQEQRIQLNQLLDLIDQAFVIMNKNLLTDAAYSPLKALQVEEQINQQRDLMRQQSNQHSENKGYNIYSILIYQNLFSALERVGDHVYNVTTALEERD